MDSILLRNIDIQLHFVTKEYHSLNNLTIAARAEMQRSPNEQYNYHGKVVLRISFLAVHFNEGINFTAELSTDRVTVYTCCVTLKSHHLLY